jgi:opacity protein-like surface antigen
MARFIGSIAAGWFLLIISSVWPNGATAQDIDAKIKKLEEIEARVDAKLKKLESLEARLEARLEAGVQPAALASGSPTYSNGNGSGAAAIGMASAAAAGGASAGHSEHESIHQVIFRGGYTRLDSAAQSAIFTGPKNDRNGWNVGAVVGVKLMKDPIWNNMLMGEVSLDYNRIAGSTKFVLGARGHQSLFRVSVTPKYRFENLGELSPSLARFHPWITPIGLSFLVNSPPSQSAAYLTVGGTTGAGIEYLLHDRLSLGLGVTYNFYSRESNNLSTNHFTLGPYVGINF